jgi:ABC-type multidrug transport system ATPase subunit
MTMNSNPIVVENLKKVYEKRGASGAVEALKGISFEVKPGEILAFLVPMGPVKPR